MMSFNWTCQYCGQTATVTEEDHSNEHQRISTSRSKYGPLAVEADAISCPNLKCRELTLKVSLKRYGIEKGLSHGPYTACESHFEWKLLPRSGAKPQPEYIPSAIVEDYNEACAVLPHSAKASATLSRRCLQGIVRDFWQIPDGKKGKLGAELSFIKDDVAPDIWEGIQAIRSVGDIGAHMEKDVNFVVDVEPDEAELLISLIEMLFDDWYVTRQKRKDSAQSAKALVAKKIEQKREAKNAAKENSESNEL